MKSGNYSYIFYNNSKNIHLVNRNNTITNSSIIFGNEYLPKYKLVKKTLPPIRLKPNLNNSIDFMKHRKSRLSFRILPPTSFNR